MLAHSLPLFLILSEDRAAMGKERSVAEYIASRPWYPGLVANIYKVVRTSELQNNPDLASFCRAAPALATQKK